MRCSPVCSAGILGGVASWVVCLSLVFHFLFWEQTYESNTNQLVNGWGMLQGNHENAGHTNTSFPCIRISMAATAKAGLLLLRVLAVAFRPCPWIVRPDRIRCRLCSANSGTRDLGATEATSRSPRMTSRRTGMSASRPSMRWSCGRNFSAASTRTVSRSRRRSSK